MRAAKTSAFLILLSLVASAVALSALRGHGQTNAPHKNGQAEESLPPLVDYGDQKTSNGDANRQARGKRYNGGGVPENGDGLQAAYLFDEWAFRVTDIPVGMSDVVIVGTTLDAQAYLSPDKHGVYCEFNVKVEEVLKDAAGALSAGSVLAVDRAGGRVRYPSGKIFTYNIADRALPLVNKRYVLFLKREEGALSIVTGYELRGGKVYPLDAPSKFKKFAGASEDSLLNQIRSAVASATSDSHGTGR